MSIPLKAVPSPRSSLILFARLLLAGITLSSLPIAPSSHFSLRAETPTQQGRIGLALAGGGALGFAHVGVLKVLHEARVPVDIVAGTSMGSIVGAAYASGATLEEIEDVLTNTDWDKLFGDGPARDVLPLKDKTGRNREILGDGKFGVVEGQLVLPTGILQGQRIRPLLQRLFYRYPEATSFDQLAIPYRAVAADIETGQPVIIAKGDLALAARASMAVPGVFAPVDLDNKLLVDGGIANNLPIDVVQQLGAQKVIAVELYADLQKREKLTNPFAISGQMLSLLLSQNSALQRARLTPSDILIEPELRGYSATDFNKARELVKLGEDAARAKLSELKAWSVSEQEYARREGIRTAQPERRNTVDFIRISNDSSIPTAVLEKRLTIKPGDTFLPEKIDASTDAILALGAFSQVSTKVISEGDKEGLEFVAQQKPWYPQYLRTGLGLEDDFDGDSFYNLAVGLRMNDVGRNGGYADVVARLGRNTALSGEFVDPFSSGSEFFYAVDGFLDRRSLFIGNNGDLLAEYGRRRIQGGLALGYGFYRSWEARFGFRRGAGEVFRRVGSPELPETNFQVSDLYSRVVLDTLDDIDFPQSGYLAQLAVSQSLADLGGQTNYTELSGQFTKPFLIGSSNIVYRGEFSYTDGTRPAGRSFTLGGFLDLSGYTQNSLAASQYVINRLMFLEELDSGSALLGYKLFGGASIELTSLQSDLAAARDRSGITSGSVFLGANTPVLPIYLGIGFAEGGNRSVYLNVGRVTSGGQRNEGG